jgi:hypothetical protein
MNGNNNDHNVAYDPFYGVLPFASVVPYSKSNAGARVSLVRSGASLGRCRAC